MSDDLLKSFEQTHSDEVDQQRAEWEDTVPTNLLQDRIEGTHDDEDNPWGKELRHEKNGPCWCNATHEDFTLEHEEGDCWCGRSH